MQASSLGNRRAARPADRRFWWGGAWLALAALFGSGAAMAQGTKPRQAPPPPPPVAAPAGLPGGASALSEVHSGWSVNCRTNGGVKRCSMAHQERSNGRILLTLEVQASAGGVSPAVLLLPFGMAVTQGVTLTVDDQKASARHAFSTCLPGGCVVPLTLDQALISQLSDGSVLKIGGTIADSQNPIAFTVPLDGFGQALARLNELSAG